LGGGGLGDGGGGLGGDGGPYQRVHTELNSLMMEFWNLIPAMVTWL
jgi:hypothetical protein